MDTIAFKDLTLSTMMLKELFSQERRSLENFFDKVDIDQVAEILKLLSECKGNILITGVGKSGIIAKKIATTMASTGKSALFLSPVNMIHGDLGLVSQDDIFLLFSKSGESDELIALLPAIRNKGAQLVAVVCKEGSRLEKRSDHTVLLPLDRELCPFNLSPTTSPTLQLLFGDIITIALMKEKGFTKSDYAFNHPAGAIGKRLFLKVSDLMLSESNIPVCRGKDKLIDILLELTNKRCGCVLVVDDEFRLQGIFTDGDLRRSFLRYDSNTMQQPIELLMTKAPRTIKPSTLVTEAMRQMEENPKSPITVLPVVEEDRLIGIIKLHDCLQAGI